MELSNPKKIQFAELIAAAPAAPAAPATTSNEAALGKNILSFNPNMSLWTVLGNTLTFLLGIGVLLSVLFITIGGIQFIIATGNKEKQKTATETIKYAIIGLALVLGFGILLNLFTGLFGTPTATPTLLVQ